MRDSPEITLASVGALWQQYSLYPHPCNGFVFVGTRYIFSPIAVAVEVVLSSSGSTIYSASFVLRTNRARVYVSIMSSP